MTLPEKLSPGGNGTRTSCMLWGICPKQSFFYHCGLRKTICFAALTCLQKLQQLSWVSTAKCSKLWACNMAQTPYEQHLVVAKTKATEQAEKPEKVKGSWGKIKCIWCCECFSTLRLTEPCLLCRRCDDMFNQKRRVGLCVSSYLSSVLCPSRNWRVRCADYRLNFTSGMSKTLYFFETRVM